MGKEDNKKHQEGGKVVTDARFAAVHYDPRFQRFPKAKATVEVDERFAGMFTDPAFEVRSTVDKRGRKVKASSKGDNMRRYYRLQGEERKQRGTGEGKGEPTDAERDAGEAGAAAGAAQKKAAGESGDSEAEAEDSDVDSEEARARERWARVRGLAGPEASSSDEEEAEEECEGGDDLLERPGRRPTTAELEAEEAAAEDAEQALLAEWGVGAMAANPREEVPLLPDATRRLACVDLDWEHVGAVDIFAALRSFLPSGGAIDRVAVYPSDYGLERMAEEAAAGPQAIFRSSRSAGATRGGGEGSNSDTSQGGGATSDEDSEEEDSESGSGGSDSGSDGGVDPERLRMYERSKLRWYYAVVECDCARSASALYDECDGMELMKTACLFDLRFVPDSHSFEGRAVRDEAASVPAEYQPPTFQTRALQHTNVELTWDTGDEGRRRALTRKLTADELKEDDFRAYLATESEGSEEEEEVGGEAGGRGGKESAEAIRERYRRLLLGGVEAGGQGAKPSERRGKKDWGGDEGGSGCESGGGAADGEMEVTFVPGLEGLGERLLAKKRDKAARAGETVWEAYLRRTREKKAAAKRLGKTNIDSDDDSGSDPELGGGSEDEEVPAGVGDDPFFQPEENPFDDPFFNEPGGGAAGDGEGRGKGDKKSGGAEKETKKGRKEARKGGAGGEEERRQRAELEMLLLDKGALLNRQRTVAADGGSGAATQGGGGKVSKKERMRLKKERRRRERQAGSDEEDHEEAAGAGFAVNLEDPRFKDLLVSTDFALDPTDPRFAKAGPGIAGIAAQVAKRRSKHQRGSDDRAAAVAQRSVKEAAAHGGGGAVPAAKSDLRLQVAALKRKAAARAPLAGDAGEVKEPKKAKRAKA